MNRLQKIREKIKNLDVDGVMITNPQNRRYLSNFSGSDGVLLISSDTAAIMTDFRFFEQVEEEVSGFVLEKQGPLFWQSVVELFRKYHWKRVGFEASAVTFQDYKTLTDLVPAPIQLVPLNDLVETLRWVKDQQEIELLAKAEQITDTALQKTMALVKPGMKEREMALEFDYQLRLQGAEGNSFTTIALSGERSSLPHGVPSEREIRPGDLVLLDCGALYQGYCADLTRTMVMGTASAEQKGIYQIVLRAQELALAHLKAGLIGSEVDKVARVFLAEQGYGQNFGHGLGHSVGLNIHESPRLSVTEKNFIPANAVITVEPGVYIPGWGGIRIEDLVVVEENGIRNLSGSPKQALIELG
jgi:Xaa-Pro aminopeptidase